MSLQNLLDSLEPDIPEKKELPPPQIKPELKTRFEREVFLYRKKNGSYDRLHKSQEYEKLQSDRVKVATEKSPFHQQLAAINAEIEAAKTAYELSPAKGTEKASRAYKEFLRDAENRKANVNDQIERIAKKEQSLRSQLDRFEHGTLTSNDVLTWRRALAHCLAEESSDVVRTPEVKLFLKLGLLANSIGFIEGYHGADFFFQKIGEQVLKTAFPECFLGGSSNKKELAAILNDAELAVRELTKQEIDRQESAEIDLIQAV